MYKNVKLGNGLAAVQSNIYGLWGYIDKLGATIIDVKYHQTKSFSIGLALVQTPEHQQWGYINRQGQFVVEPTDHKAFPLVKGGTAFTYISRAK